MSYTLRDLPLPVKVVVSVFLMAVGIGYTSALVQLHMQDSKSGKPMPTVEDVILKYTGKKKRDPNAPPQQPVSRLEALVTSPTVAISGASMSAAFTTEDRAKGALKFASATKGQPPGVVEVVKAQRKGEQTIFKLWINATEDERKAAYAADKFVPPAGQMPALLTSAFRDGDAVKIKSIIDNRCVTCHSKGGDKEDIPLDTYDGLDKFMKVETTFAATGDWVKIEEPISITKLTQSTHAHLLSFAMLFSLTGLVFAFSSYPTVLRCVLGPWVVLAVTADVSLWWLARLCDQWGPYFAMGIIATGGAAGAGLFGQIILSLFNMYGRKGKGVIGGIIVLGAVIASLVWVNKIDKGLQAKNIPQVKPEEKVPDPKGAPEIKSPFKLTDQGFAALRKANVPETVLSKIDALKNKAFSRQELVEAITKALDKNELTQFQDIVLKYAEDGQARAVEVKKTPYRPIHDIDRLLTLPVLDEKGDPVLAADVQWNGSDKGSMAAAFFEKDKVFKKLMEDPEASQETKDKLRAEREAELEALVAWGRAVEAARASGYTGNGFEVPPALASKMNSKFVTDGKVKIRSLIDARCVACHGPDGKQSDYPLDTFEGLSKYLAPFAPAVAPVPPVPVPPKPVDPIPPSKDD